MSETPCEACGGKRLKPEALAVKIAGSDIGEATALSVRDARAWFGDAAGQAHREAERDRRPHPQGDPRAPDLPGRCRPRIPDARPRLRHAVGRREPAHPPRLADRLRPHRRALRARRALDRPAPARQRAPARHAEAPARPRQHGDRRRARRGRDPARPTTSFDIGPGAGIHGGEIVAEGTPAEILREPELAHRQVPHRRADRARCRRKRRKPQKGRMLKLVGARGNNLKDVTAEIPLGTFTCITGVSGGGKSTLVIDTLYKAVARKLNGALRAPGPVRPHRGPGASRQGHRHRPVADRPHAALEPGDLYRRLHADPRMVRRPARGQGARLPAGALLLQRQGRALRGLPGRRRHQDRDALPARRLRHLRRVQGQALRPRDAGGEVPRASRSPTCST